MLDVNEVSIIYKAIMDTDADVVTLKNLAEKFQSTKSLRQHLMLTPKFRINNPKHSYRGSILREPKLIVEVQKNDDSILKIFDRIQSDWERIGNLDPYWSVLSSEDMRESKLDEQAIHYFYETGQKVAEEIVSTLDRSGLKKNFKVINEYGCGLGRTSKWLSSIGEKIYCYDISLPHLLIAKKILKFYNINSVNLRHIKKIDDVAEMEFADLFYCDLVLQHNPPPAMVYILVQLLNHLKKEGIGIFQLPTYRCNYSFKISSYLESAKPESSIEMHILPQPKVFELIRDAKCIVHEVIEDQKAGSPDIISNTFVVEKL